MYFEIDVSIFERGQSENMAMSENASRIEQAAAAGGNRKPSRMSPALFRVKRLVSALVDWVVEQVSLCEEKKCCCEATQHRNVFSFDEQCSSFSSLSAFPFFPAPGSACPSLPTPPSPFVRAFAMDTVTVRTAVLSECSKKMQNNADGMGSCVVNDNDDFQHELSPSSFSSSSPLSAESCSRREAIRSAVRRLVVNSCHCLDGGYSRASSIYHMCSPILLTAATRTSVRSVDAVGDVIVDPMLDDAIHQFEFRTFVTSYGDGNAMGPTLAKALAKFNARRLCPPSADVILYLLDCGANPNATTQCVAPSLFFPALGSSQTPRHEEMADAKVKEGDDHDDAGFGAQHNCGNNAAGVSVSTPTLQTLANGKRMRCGLPTAADKDARLSTSFCASAHQPLVQPPGPSAKHTEAAAANTTTPHGAYSAPFPPSSADGCQSLMPTTPQASKIAGVFESTAEDQSDSVQRKRDGNDNFIVVSRRRRADVKAQQQRGEVTSTMPSPLASLYPPCLRRSPTAPTSTPFRGAASSQLLPMAAFIRTYAVVADERRIPAAAAGAPYSLALRMLATTPNAAAPAAPQTPVADAVAAVNASQERTDEFDLFSNFADPAEKLLLTVLHRFIECGADVDGNEGDGWTALHAAAHVRSPAAVRFLLAAGADSSVLVGDCYNRELIRADLSLTLTDDSHVAIQRLLLDVGGDSVFSQLQNHGGFGRGLGKKSLETVRAMFGESAF